MKITKQLLALLLVLVFALGTYPVTIAAEIVESGDYWSMDNTTITWTLDSEGTLTVSGEGAMGSSPGGNAPWREFSSSIKKVIIEEGITQVGEQAFYGYNNLESVEIASSVTRIARSAFSHSIYLKSVTFNGNGLKTIAGYAFYDCGGLVDFSIPESVETIEEYAFYDCLSLEKIIIPDSVKTVGEKAFFWCESLKSVVIGNGVTELGSEVFYDCSALESVIIGNSLTRIPASAFAKCSALESVVFGNSVTAIDEAAFYECTALKTIAIPDGVQLIGDFAFAKCSGLETVIIPKSVTRIFNLAFVDSDRICNVYYAGSKAEWDRINIGEFNMSLTDASIHYNSTGNKVTWAYENGVLTFSGEGDMPGYRENIPAPWLEYAGDIKSVVIENGITSVDNYAFHNCTGIEEITLPDSVQTIGKAAFSGCTALTEIHIPISVTTIKYNAFDGCVSLSDVYYSGSEYDWQKVDIAEYGNSPLFNATIHYASENPTTEPPASEIPSTEPPASDDPTTEPPASIDPTTEPPASDEPSQTPGDLNGNNEVDAGDATMLLRAAVGMLELTPEQLAAADMNKNGMADAGDATIILRIAVGMNE